MKGLDKDYLVLGTKKDGQARPFLWY